MLLNLSRDVEQLLKEVVEAFGNRNGPSLLFDMLFDSKEHDQLSFICNDEMHMVSAHAPRAKHLAKWDSGECHALLIQSGLDQQKKGGDKHCCLINIDIDSSMYL